MVSVTNYNLSEVTEASGNKFVALLQYTSEQTNYVPGLIILLTMYFVIFFSLKNKGYGTPGIFAKFFYIQMVLLFIFWQMYSGINNIAGVSAIADSVGVSNPNDVSVEDIESVKVSPEQASKEYFRIAGFMMYLPLALSLLSFKLWEICYCKKIAGVRWVL